MTRAPRPGARVAIRVDADQYEAETGVVLPHGRATGVVVTVEAPDHPDDAPVIKVRLDRPAADAVRGGTTRTAYFVPTDLRRLRPGR